MALQSPLTASTKKAEGVTVDDDLKAWHVYILRCRDDSLYTGITTNLERRLTEHNTRSNGASYTRGRRPVTLVYNCKMADRSSASREEWRIKQLPRERKEALIRSRHTPSHRLR